MPDLPFHREREPEQAAGIRAFLHDFDGLYPHAFSPMPRAEALIVYMLMRLEESIDAISEALAQPADDTPDDEPWKRSV